MINKFYTLNDTEYRDALIEAAKSCDYISGVDLFIGGGAVIQLLMSDQLDKLRPTLDVDVVCGHSLDSSEGLLWLDKVSDSLRAKGYSIESAGDSGFPFEVSINGLPSTLIVSLTKYDKEFHSSYPKRMEGELNRLRESTFEGLKFRYHHPVDIIVGKVIRYYDFTKRDSFSVDLKPEYSRFFDKLQNNPDDIDTKDYTINLEELIEDRSANLEIIGRENLRDALNRVGNYKIGKDVYDICRIIEMDNAVSGFDFRVFSNALNIALIETENYHYL